MLLLLPVLALVCLSSCIDAKTNSTKKEPTRQVKQPSTTPSGTGSQTGVQLRSYEDTQPKAGQIYNVQFPNNNAYDASNFVQAKKNLFVPSHTAFYANLGFSYIVLQFEVPKQKNATAFLPYGEVDIRTACLNVAGVDWLDSTKENANIDVTFVAQWSALSRSFNKNRLLAVTCSLLHNAKMKCNTGKSFRDCTGTVDKSSSIDNYNDALVKQLNLYVFRTLKPSGHEEELKKMIQDNPSPYSQPGAINTLRFVNSPTSAK